MISEMSKSKGPKWIAKIDYKVCLRINKKYYRKKDQGLLLNLNSINQNAKIWFD